MQQVVKPVLLNHFSPKNIKHYLSIHRPSIMKMKESLHLHHQQHQQQVPLAQPGQVAAPISPSTLPICSYLHLSLHLLSIFIGVVLGIYLISHLLFDYPLHSALISLGIGYLMLYTLYLTQGYLQSFYEKNRHNLMGSNYDQIVHVNTRH